MSSPSAVLTGEQAPQIMHRPPDVATLAAAEEAVELADAYGLTLDESQCITLEVGMGERPDGTWAARTMGDAEPRQNGKTDSVVARELHGLIVGDERLQIHTAHLYPTAQEAFLRMVDLFDNYDDLRKRAKKPRMANGEQGIYLLNGARLLYKARSGGSGRGFAEADLVVYDEAQELQGEHVAASGGARLANTNSQAWYAGSGGMSTSKLWWRMRRRAVRHDDGRFGYVEHTAEHVAVDDRGRVVGAPLAEVTDRALWAMANPAYGARISDESLEDYRLQVGDALFARESLCVWEPCLDDGDEADEGTITKATWVALYDDKSRIAGARSIALDVSPDYQWATFAAAGRRDDMLVHLEAFDTRPGTGWIVAAASSLAARWAAPIRVQDGSPAGAFVGDMRQQGATVDVVSARDHAAAIGMLLTGIENKRLRIMPSATLTTAATNADLRPYGDVELWVRRNAKVNITPIVAVTLALGGVPEASEFYMPRRLR